ncbi:MAG TPA: hypothetical protein VFV50_17145 [Bdellovibrionales bacterium]|nr:hypothetical protein [Bdellovibrionales bacterium]
MSVFKYLAVVFFSVNVAQAAVCTIPENDDLGVDEATRRACLSIGSFAAEPPQLSPADIVQGPPGKNDFNSRAHVHCRFFAREQGGSSAKFRCYRTNENNVLFNNDGELRPEAARVGVHGAADEDWLYDARGNLLKNSKGKPEKADVLKVRYSDGTERNRENFTTAAAGRIMWALGFPSERFYPVAKVTCFGCGSHPFRDGQTGPLNGRSSDFEFATIEKKYQGPRIMKERGNTKAWKWSEATALVPARGRDIQTEYEELVLLANLFHIVEERGSQHVLVCDPGAVDKGTRECKKPYLMIHDVGAAFGARIPRRMSGAAKPNNPRGDYAAYKQVTVLSKNCELTLKAGGLAHVSEAAREAFVRRLDRLTPQLLRSALEASNFSHVDKPFRARIAKSEKLSGAALDQHVLELWQKLIEEKFDQVRSARCR